MLLSALRIKLSFIFLLLFSTLAFAQGGGGSVIPQGAITPGNCTKFGTSKYFVADAGAPCASGSGSVSSVGLALPVSVFSISGSPVTTTGTLTGSFLTQSANTLFAGPTTGAAAVPAFRSLIAADVPSSILPGGFTGFGNPTNPSVNLTGSNGVATTAMRSDAVLVLDQTPAYAFTGLGNTNLLTASTFGWNGDLFLTRSAAARIQLGLADAAAPTAQTLRTQGVVTGTSNTAGQNFTIDVSPGTGTGAGGSFIVRTANVGGAGSTQNALASRFTVAADGSGTLSSGNIQFNQNGAITASALQSTNIIGLGNGTGQLTVGGSGGISLQGNTPLRAPSAAILQLGSNDAASPVAQTLRAQGSRAGTDTNIGGANLTIFSGTGTGTGAISSLILQSPVAVASGTGVQTQTTGLTINKGTAATSGYLVSTLPTTPLTGSRAHVIDQLTACVGTGLALTGGGAIICPAFYNGSAWVGG